MNDNPHSKRVVIKRKLAIGDYNQKDLEEILSGSSRSIGAYWDKGSKKSGTGLTYDEIRTIMPIILSTEATDRDFRTKCDIYFDEMDTRIPAKTGLELEVGLDEHGVPLVATDYVAYRHAIKHPQVAISESVAKTNPLIKWYVEDPEAELKKENDILGLKDEALQLYLANKDNKKMVNMVLDLSNVKVIEAKKQGEFKKLSENKPAHFKKLILDKDIKIQYLIHQAISQGILLRKGEYILWNESGETIGNGVGEVVEVLKDKAKAPMLNKIKASLKDFED